MIEDSITYFSVRNRNLNQDLRVVHDALRSYLPDMNVQYYINNEVSDNQYITNMLRASRREFCQYVHHVICMDASVPLSFPNDDGSSVRIFMAALYDYLFEAALGYANDPQKPKKSTYIGCNYILPGSPFASRVLKTAYNMKNSDITTLDQICLPLSWDIAQEDKRKKVRKRFEYYYPGMKDKKILVIVLADPKDIKAGLKDNPLIGFPLKQLLDMVKDEYFVITTSDLLAANAANLSSKYNSSFEVSKNRFTMLDLLYIADVMVTNESRYATGVAPVNKPVYVLGHEDNMFLRYMKKFYPGMVISDFNDILGVDFHADNNSEEQKLFCKEFSYGVDEEPMKKIASLFM